MWVCMFAWAYSWLCGPGLLGVAEMGSRPRCLSVVDGPYRVTFFGFSTKKIIPLSTLKIVVVKFENFINKNLSCLG